MTIPAQNSAFMLGCTLRRAAFAMLGALTMIATQLQAQTYTLIHNFSGGADGAAPAATLTIDSAGNLYGTTSSGGTGHGGVFKLKHVGSSWVFSSLYNFAGESDGSGPFAPVIFGPNGTLFGTSYEGADGGCGNGNGCGTVFNLRPPATFCRSVNCPWVETVLYRFIGNSDGGNPEGPLLFDSVGNIYGTARQGGMGNCAGFGCGTVYKLTHSGNNWTQSVLYSFTGGTDEGLPDSGVVFDSSGNLFGTTQGCTGDTGIAFELMPSGAGWNFSTIFIFGGATGNCPVAGLIFDHSGNLYGATALDAVVFELTFSVGSWMVSKSLTIGNGADCGPQESLVMDSAGNLYGTTFCAGANGLGSVFKLTPVSGGFMYTSLHDFVGGNDGANPYGGVVLDSSGNVYGTTYAGGTGTNCMGGCGLVFKINP